MTSPTPSPAALVVGAAIVRHGRVLAARRTRPTAVGGGWEFPGGKVEVDESSEDALVREVAEELSCRITVDDWLDGEQPIGQRFVLRVAVCRLVDGEPTTGHDHDEVRWLRHSQLDDVEWLQPDRPFLRAVREHLLGSGA
jgi:8-oxo-dGTP diphosphatase